MGREAFRPTRPTLLTRPTYLTRLFLLQGDREVRAAVPCATRGCLVRVDRAILAEAHRAEPRRVDAPADQVIARRVGATLAERQVVLLRADGVSVTFDGHLNGRIRLQL